MTPILALLLACATPWMVPPSGPVPAGSAPGSPTAPGAQTVEPVSFAPLEERVNVLIADAQESDRRDRLQEARELMHAMRGQDPAAQRKVYLYLDKVLTIEERAKEEPLPGVDRMTPIEEENLGGSAASGTTPAPLPDVAAPPSTTLPGSPSPADAAVATARTALAAGKYLDAVAALDPIDTPDAHKLRREAIDGWARAEREAAGQEFIKARAMAAGPDRIAALKAVRAHLDGINARFPDNAYTSQIKDNIARVDADLTAAGASP